MKKEVLRPKGRRLWSIKPVTKIHSTPKGAKGYNRKSQKKIEKEGLKNDSEQDLLETR